MSRLGPVALAALLLAPLGAAAFGQAAGSDGGGGRLAVDGHTVRGHCSVCHSYELVEAQRLDRALPQQAQRSAQRLEGLAARLQALDPRQVLARGYTWLDDGQGRALGSVDQLHEGQDLRAVLADGEADLRVGRIARRER